MWFCAGTREGEPVRMSVRYACRSQLLNGPLRDTNTGHASNTVFQRPKEETTRQHVTTATIVQGVSTIGGTALLERIWDRGAH